MKIETGHKQIMEEYRKCVNHNLLQDYYNKTQQHYDFYAGNQWRGVYAPDLDKPVINFIRRVSQFLTAMIAGEDIGLFVTPYIHTEENVRAADITNIMLEKVTEDAKLKTNAYSVVLEGAVTGEGYLYWYKEGNTLRCRQLKGRNVLFANPYSTELQKQPFILVEKKEFLEDAVEQAKAAGREYGRLKADDDYMQAAECIPMVTVITKLYKEGGQVWYTQVTKDAVITPPVPMGTELYPLAAFIWDKRNDSYHGIGVVENLIPNQIAVNKLWAMALLHQKTMAFPKIFFDRTKLDKWTNKVGAAIGVIGNPNDAVVTSFRADDMSGQVMELVEKTISYTKEAMGANDTSLGNVTPENTSAILAVQRSATIPLENQKQAFRQFLEDCVHIMLDIISHNFGERYIETAAEDGWKMEKYDFSAMDATQISCAVQVEAATPWSDGIQMQTLENLYARKILTDAYDYVRAIPASHLKNKQQILKKLKQLQERKQPESAT